VFKVQANMDPNHRDRVAFVRLCSGKLVKGMRLKQVRTGKQVPVNAPLFFFAKERQVAEEAWPGDVVGVANHGTLRIGDTLTEGEELNFRGVPSFAPEILRTVRLEDPMGAKKLRTALGQLAEEGVVQLFRPLDGSPPVVGVVGQLQLDVLQSRLRVEYGVPAGFDASMWTVARWVAPADPPPRRAARRWSASPPPTAATPARTTTARWWPSSPPTGGGTGRRRSGRCCASTRCGSSMGWRRLGGEGQLRFVTSPPRAA
jgi:peptide chain release factor 3